MLPNWGLNEIADILQKIFAVGFPWAKVTLVAYHQLLSLKVQLTISHLVNGLAPNMQQTIASCNGSYKCHQTSLG